MQDKNYFRNKIENMFISLNQDLQEIQNVLSSIIITTKENLNK
jgi:hypothetical protein